MSLREYPFGMLMPGRQWKAATSENYRYGYNGQEEDDEVYGNANATTASFWEYDPRLGRRWNIDPIFNSYSSPYLTFNGNPILFNDINGDCPDGNCEDEQYVLADELAHKLYDHSNGNITIEEAEREKIVDNFIDQHSAEIFGGEIESYIPIVNGEYIEYYPYGRNAFKLLVNDIAQSLVQIDNYKASSFDSYETRISNAATSSDKAGIIKERITVGNQAQRSAIFASLAFITSEAGGYASMGSIGGMRAATAIKIRGVGFIEEVSAGAGIVSSNTLQKLTFNEVQALARANSIEMNAFFKSGGTVIPDKQVLLNYRELATRILNQTGGATSKKLTPIAMAVQTKRLEMINKALETFK